MKLKKLYIICLLLIGFSSAAIAEENYWLKIKEFDGRRENLESISEREKISSKQVEFINSLDANQLLISGRQFWEYCEINRPGSSDSVFSDGPLELIYIVRQYPKKGGLVKLEPLFRELNDTNQNVFWRTTLLLFMREENWLKVLDNEQIYSAIDGISAIVLDRIEHQRLRCEASETVRKLLEQLEKNNLLAEPIIEEKLQNGKQLKELRKEVADNKIILSDNYKQAQKKTVEYYDNHVQVLLTVLNEPDLKPILQKSILRGLKNSLKQKIEHTAQVQNALESAVRNYSKFDKEHWDYLVQIGYEELQLPDSNNIAQKMWTELQNKLEIEKDKKNKIQIKSEMKSLEKLQKKFKKEKQIQPDPNIGTI
jgi:hypothetical protein